MNTARHQHRSKRIVCLIVLLLLTQPLTGANAAKEQSDKLLLIEYYRLLELMQDTPPPQKIVLLHEFMESRADFEDIYMYLFDQYLLSNLLDDAADYFQSLLSHGKSESNCLWMLAKIYASQDQHHLAREMYLKGLNAAAPSLALAEDAVDYFCSQGQSQQLKHVQAGRVYKTCILALTELEQARYQKALSLFIDLNKTGLHPIFCQYYCGYCNFKLARYDDAAACWQNSLDASRLQGALRQEALILVGLGALSYTRGRYSHASHFLELAEKIISRIDDFRIEEYATGHHAEFELSQGNHERAISRFERAAQLSLSLHEFDHAAAWYLGKGRALFSADSLNAVLPCLETSEHYARLKQNPAMLLELRMERGRFYHHLNLTELARHEFVAAVQAARELDWPCKLEIALDRYAEMLIREKRFLEARRIYGNFVNAIVPGSEPGRLSHIHWKIGETYRLQDSLRTARAHYSQALEFALRQQDHNEAALANLRLGDVQLGLRHFDDAIQFYNEALLADFTTENWELQIELNMGMGHAYRGKKELDRAIMFYNRAANVIEENRGKLMAAQFRLGYFSRGASVYDALIQAYFERYRQRQDNTVQERLFHCMEMSRARVLRDLKNNGAARPGANSDYRRACEELERIQRYLRLHPESEDSLKTELEAARYNSINRRLMLMNKANAETPANALTLNDLRAGLEHTDFGLLFYHISEYQSFVLIVNQDQVVILPMEVDGSHLASQVDSLISPFTNVTVESLPETRFRADIAHRLYTLLIQPAEKKVALKNNLIIIPDFPLTSLPFELLLTKLPRCAAYAPGDSGDYADSFLLHRYSFIYSPSTWLIEDKAGPAPSVPGILILANPTNDHLPHYDLSSAARPSRWATDLLLFADEEAQNIKRSGKRVKIFHRNTATRDSLFAHARSYPIIHFATHAFVDSVFDAFSGLVLAPGVDAADDGLLMGYEIADAHLPCELITLSACETARGNMLPGEGILGLPRLFFSSGARNVLMTHWNVDDKFTSKLMPRFYDYLLEENLSKSEALKQAQLSLIRATNEGSQLIYHHPVYWASFVLYGMPDISTDYFVKNGNLRPTLIVVFALALLLGLLIRFSHRRSSKSIA
ncbi:MAG: CHAT domain-containing protein [Candidatus Zhuqueibacterota bacterium]